MRCSDFQGFGGKDLSLHSDQSHICQHEIDKRRVSSNVEVQTLYIIKSNTGSNPHGAPQLANISYI